MPNGCQSTCPFPFQVSFLLPSLISSMVSTYSPISTFLPFSSEALFVVGVVLLMSFMFEHWKYFFESSSTSAKSRICVLSPVKATDDPLVTTGFMRMAI